MVHELASSTLIARLSRLCGRHSANFPDEWEELYGHSIGLLRDADAAQLISALIDQRDELGHALRALRCLGGYVFTEPTEDATELQQIHEAADVLRMAEQTDLAKHSPLADLLRYVVFSATGSSASSIRRSRCVSSCCGG